MNFINYDISKLSILELRSSENEIKGTCNCSPFSVPEYAYCLEMHTPKSQLLAKRSQFQNYPTNYDYLFYGDISN